MDIPGLLISLVSKIEPQCGFVTTLLGIAIVWLALLLVKFIKLNHEQSLAYEKIAVTLARMEARTEAILYSFRPQQSNDDD
jgi:hypothetical protein